MSPNGSGLLTPSSTLHEHPHPAQFSSGHSLTVGVENSNTKSDKRCPCPSATAPYPGEGTPYSPYIVNWAENDPENPYNWSRARKWVITMQLASSTFTVSFGSSSYSGGIQGVMRDFNTSEDVAILGISLYVLGFALGPLVFAPVGEASREFRVAEMILIAFMIGRCSEGSRIVFLVTLTAYTLFQLMGSLGHSLAVVLTCRLLTGIVGASPLSNAGGAISDIWNARERGLACAIYATVPFLGPVIGPIVGGFVVENLRLGWHFNFWIIFIFGIITLCLGYCLTPETYSPILLRRRAERLSVASNGLLHYVSIHDVQRSRSFFQIMRMNLSRPFVFIFTEPIVLLLAIYISIMYGTLYALFSAFPIVFQQHRGFTPGQGGLAFLGVGLGIILGVGTQSYQDKLYRKIMDKSPTGKAPPEARLYTAILGGMLVPVGLFMFAWTTSPAIHWIVPILAGIPFGAGVAQILQSLTAYLMDTYPLYFASSVAATIVMRSFCGAAFPLFSPAMFAALGDQWAMSVFAFLSLACTPIPILFRKYGSWIRSKSRVASKDPVQDVPATTPSSHVTVIQQKVEDTEGQK